MNRRGFLGALALLPAISCLAGYTLRRLEPDDMAGDFEVADLRYKATERYSAGFTDFKGVFGRDWPTTKCGTCGQTQALPFFQMKLEGGTEPLCDRCAMEAMTGIPDALRGDLQPKDGEVVVVDSICEEPDELNERALERMCVEIQELVSDRGEVLRIKPTHVTYFPPRPLFPRKRGYFT